MKVQFHEIFYGSCSKRIRVLTNKTCDPIYNGTALEIFIQRFNCLPEEVKDCLTAITAELEKSSVHITISGKVEDEMITSFFNACAEKGYLSILEP